MGNAVYVSLVRDPAQLLTSAALFIIRSVNACDGYVPHAESFYITRRKERMIFELVVFDTKKQAEEFTPIITNTHVQRAVFVGEGLCGVRYRQCRPNKLTRKHRPLTTDYERDWEVNCLLPALDWRGVYK